MMKGKILFLHGFFASGQCEMAKTLREELNEQAVVITPDLPMYPEDALCEISDILHQEKPDIVVGSSCGAFYAQQFVSFDAKTILINPFFLMHKFLEPRIGFHQYKSERKDRKQDFEITEDLVNHFRVIEKIQFIHYNPDLKKQVYGLFGDKDTLAHFRQLYLEYYSNDSTFDGAHTMTAQNVRETLVPLIKNIGFKDGCIA